MRRKYGSYYADWRDEHGNRRMKAFPTKKQATRYQNRMRSIAAAKKQEAHGASGKRATRGQNKKHAARDGQQHERSSHSPAISKSAS